jgi:hypothetical protein
MTKKQTEKLNKRIKHLIREYYKMRSRIIEHNDLLNKELLELKIKHHKEITDRNKEIMKLKEQIIILTKIKPKFFNEDEQGTGTQEQDRETNRYRHLLILKPTQHQQIN